MRSDAAGHQQIAVRLGVRVIPVELVDPYYYHLDTCFCPLRKGLAIYYPAAFDDYGRRAIAEAVDEFVKAGGSAKCLTLRLDGEDAAAWRKGSRVQSRGSSRVNER